MPTHMLKNQYDSSILPWHIAYLIFGITSGMARCAWPHTYEWTELYKYVLIYVYLTICKKCTSYYGYFLDIANSLFWITLGKPEHNHLKWLNKLVSKLDQKTNSIIPLILEMKLTHCLTPLRAYPGIPHLTHLK